MPPRSRTPVSARRLDPNSATPDELRSAAPRLLALPTEPSAELARLARELTSVPGAQRAWAAVATAGDGTAL